jgi:hypothetical protein
LKHIYDLSSSVLKGGLDSLTYSVLFNLAYLAQNSSSQEKILKEINDVLGKNDSIALEDLDKMFYLRAFIKETFR